MFDYDPMEQAGSMVFSRQEYWSGLPFPPPRDFPDRDRSRVSCIDRRILYTGATQEAQHA